MWHTWLARQTNRWSQMEGASSQQQQRHPAVGAATHTCQTNTFICDLCDISFVVDSFYLIFTLVAVFYSVQEKLLWRDELFGYYCVFTPVCCNSTQLLYFYCVFCMFIVTFTDLILLLWNFIFSLIVHWLFSFSSIV